MFEFIITVSFGVNSTLMPVYIWVVRWSAPLDRNNTADTVWFRCFGFQRWTSAQM